MIDFNNSYIENAIMHKVGNSYTGENNFFSLYELSSIKDFNVNEIKLVFSKPFRQIHEINEFYHTIDINQNVIYKIAQSIFEKSDFILESKKIAQYLYDKSVHYSIKSGELLILKFSNLVFENKYCNGIGIFKIENESSFFKKNFFEKTIDMILEKGIASKNIEKACLILELDYFEGFTVFNYEKNKVDSLYWTANFLNIRLKINAFNATNVLLKSFKDFIINDNLQDIKTKREKIETVNKSIEYFETDKNKATIDEFIEENFDKTEDANNFYSYLRNTVNDDLPDAFEISSEAIKLQKRKLKSIIKLDKNFHIYIHGNENLIEQGIDENGKKFYKLYYDLET